MNRLWMPFFINDYLADTTALTTVEHGAYFLLIAHYWQRGDLPTSDRELARIVRLPLKKWLSIRPQISAYFDAEWRHARIEKEIKNATVRVARKAAAGRLGGLAKAARSASNATLVLQQQPSKTLHNKHRYSTPYSGREGRNGWIGGESSPTVVQGETGGDRATHECPPAGTAQIIPLSAVPRDEFSPSRDDTQPGMPFKSPEKARELGRAPTTTEDSDGPKAAAGGASEAISSGEAIQAVRGGE